MKKVTLILLCVVATLTVNSQNVSSESISSHISIRNGKAVLVSTKHLKTFRLKPRTDPDWTLVYPKTKDTLYDDFTFERIDSVFELSKAPSGFDQNKADYDSAYIKPGYKIFSNDCKTSGLELTIYRNWFLEKEVGNHRFWVKYDQKSKTFVQGVDKTSSTSVPWVKLSIVLLLLIIFSYSLACYPKTSVRDSFSVDYNFGLLIGLTTAVVMFNIIVGILFIIIFDGPSKIFEVTPMERTFLWFFRLMFMFVLSLVIKIFYYFKIYKQEKTN